VPRDLIVGGVGTELSAVDGTRGAGGTYKDSLGNR